MPKRAHFHTIPCKVQTDKTHTQTHLHRHSLSHCLQRSEECLFIPLLHWSLPLSRNPYINALPAPPTNIDYNNLTLSYNNDSTYEDNAPISTERNFFCNYYMSCDSICWHMNRNKGHETKKNKLNNLAFAKMRKDPSRKQTKTHKVSKKDQMINK